MRPLHALSLLAAVAVGAPAWGVTAWAQPPTVAAVKKAVRKALGEREPRARASALGKALSGADGPEYAKAVTRLVLAQDEPAIVKNVAVVMLGRMSGSATLPALRALAGEGELEPRAHVTRAIARSRIPGANDVLEQLVHEQPGPVAAAALAGLADRAEEASGATALGALTDPRWETRGAALLVLGALKRKQHGATLCEAMKREDGRLVDDFAHALERISGQAYGADPDRYRSWFDGQGGVVPPEPWEPPAASFASPLVETRSRRILFVLSRSISMADAVDGAAHAAGVHVATSDAGEDLGADLKAAKTKLEVARVHLRVMLRSLRDGVRFDVMTYASSPDFAFGELTKATDRTRKKAEGRVASLSASGDADIYGALRRAFDPKGKDPLGAAGGPDTIVLLSDGNLQEPYTTDREEIQRAVDHWKRSRQIVIHVVAVGQSVTQLLGPLAQGAPPGAFVSVP